MNTLEAIVTNQNMITIRKLKNNRFEITLLKNADVNKNLPDDERTYEEAVTFVNNDLMQGFLELIQNTKEVIA